MGALLFLLKQSLFAAKPTQMRATNGVFWHGAAPKYRAASMMRGCRCGCNFAIPGGKPFAPSRVSAKEGPAKQGSVLSLRKKIVDSAWFNQAVEDLFAAYIRFAYRTSRWERSGFEAMDEALRSGTPVIVALWHQRLMMSPYLFDASLGKMCTLTSGARAGRLAGQVQARFGFDTIAMSSHKRHIALSREVLDKIRDGFSIGIATDGPRGPARVASTVPLIWARASGIPIFVVSFSARRVIAFPTWDKMWLPAPWTRGVLMCRKWDNEVPRKASDAQTEALRLKLEQALDTITNTTDRATGRLPET